MTKATDAADQLGLNYEMTQHGPVNSLEEAAAARGIEPAKLIKTIVVRLADDDYRFILVPGDREIAWPKLRTLLGVKRMSMPDKDTAFAVTGYLRGTITPLGSTHAWPVIADERITGTISIGGGDFGTGITVDADELAKALNATVADVTD
ncbi:aminoacyl-tRNA deacylase [Kribbella sp. NPDC056951]|uniref:aminoacyl-tRNA deacylase n=1 Tax=Kribbella sp. NPDC056951 TaxID=3345978 RepID=UPI00363D821C